MNDSIFSFIKHFPILAMLAGSSLVSAQDIEVSQGASISIGETFTFSSQVLAENREIYISLPDDYALSSIAYPVVYVLDAEELGNFQLVKGILAALDTDGVIPETIVVGIVNSVGPTNVNRTRDFSPSRSSDGQGGGADTFLRFISEELQPFINAQYRVDPFNILIGHSMSGLFAIHTLLNKSEAFDAYIAISPSVWWNDEEINDRAKALIGSDYAFDNKTLFMSLADEEPSAPHKNLVEIISYHKPEGLNFANIELPEDSHGTTRIRSVYFGLQHIYDGWLAPSYISSLEELLSHYEKLSEKYGYQVKIPEMEMRIQAQNILLNNDDGPEIIKTYSYLRDNYPISPDTYGGLAAGLKRTGQLDEAYSLNAKAIAMAEEQKHPFLVYYLEAKAELETLILERNNKD